jgi:hypothetical protein
MTTLMSTHEYNAEVRCLLCLERFEIKSKEDAEKAIEHLEGCSHE